jgi:iron complex outermembrane receptor protein
VAADVAPVRETLMMLLKTLVVGMMVAMTGAAVAAEPAPRVVTLDIPAQPLSDALSELARQSGFQIVFHSQVGKGLTAERLNGRFTLDAALKRLLHDTGLEYSYLKDDAVAIRSTTDKTPATTTGAATAEPVAMRLAQSGGASAPGAGTGTVEPPPVTSGEKTQGEMVVTGTQIRGAQPSSPMVTITQEDMRLAGHNNLGEMVRALPQNYSGGQNPGVLIGSNNPNANFTGSSSFNLRGLGPSATLTLLNGTRLPYDGDIQAIDVSVVPLSAIERVEVLLDGASAIYGSDAVGGVANIIL